MLSMKMSDGGRVVIPAEIRRSLGLKEGDDVLFELRDGEAIITTRQMRIARAQALFQSWVPREEGHSQVDAFIAERRQAAEQE